MAVKQAMKSYSKSQKSRNNDLWYDLNSKYFKDIKAFIIVEKEVLLFFVFLMGMVFETPTMLAMGWLLDQFHLIIDIVGGQVIAPDINILFIIFGDDLLMQSLQ